MPERPGSLPLAELVAEQRARLSLSLAAVAKRMGTAADEEGEPQRREPTDDPPDRAGSHPAP